jgi:dephospho-CoA kinase
MNLTPEQQEQLKSIIFKLSDGGASKEQIAYATAMFYKNLNISVPPAIAQLLPQKQDQIQKDEPASKPAPTAMSDTLTGDVEADVLSSGANIANPDFWKTQETNPNDWIAQGSGRYFNQVTGEIMEAGAVGTENWNQGQMDLYTELDRNENLKQSITSNTVVDTEQDTIDEYWSNHAPDNPGGLRVLNREDYTYNPTWDTVSWGRGGTVFMSDVKEDDAVHGETVKVLKQQGALDKKKGDKVKKEEKDEALQSMPTVSDGKGEMFDRGKGMEGVPESEEWFNNFKKNASKYGFIIEGTFQTSYIHRTYIKITHDTTGKSIDGRLFETKESRAQADAFMRDMVEGKKSVVRTLSNAVERDLASTSEDRAAQSRNEVDSYVEKAKLIEDGLESIESMASENVAADQEFVQQSEQKAIEAYAKFLTSPVKERVHGSRGFKDHSGDAKVKALGFDPRYYILANQEERDQKKELYNKFISGGGKIDEVPYEYLNKERYYYKELLPDKYGSELQNWARETYRLMGPNAKKEFLKKTDSQVEKFFLEAYKKDNLGKDPATSSGTIAKGTFEHVKSAKLKVAVERYIAQAGITDRDEINKILKAINQRGFKIEDLDKFQKNIDSGDSFTTVALDTIYNDISVGDADVMDRATNSARAAYDAEAVEKSIDQQIRDMDYSTFTVGEVQELIKEEIKLDDKRVTAELKEKEVRAVLINDKYKNNKIDLESKLDARSVIVEKLNEISSGDYKTQDQVDEAQESLNELKAEYDDITQEIQKGLNTSELLYNVASKMDEELRELGIEVDEIDLYSKLISKNYSPGARMAFSAVSTLVDMGEGAYEFMGMINDTVDEASSWVLKGLGVDNETVEAWCMINDYIPLVGGFTTGPLLQKSTRNEFHGYVDKWQESVESGLGKAISFDDIDSIGSFGGWFGNMFASQVPNLALMYATGGYSLYVMGATSSGSKYKDLREQDELYKSSDGLYGNNYTFGQMLSTALITGTAEALSEKITLGQVKTAKAMWKGMSKEALQKAIKPSVGDFLIKNVVGKKALKRQFIDTFEEGGSEVAATMAENLTSMYILGDKDVHLLDGVAESFVSGALISRTIGTFGIAGQAMTTFSDPSLDTKKSAYVSRLQTITEILGSGEEKNALISSGRRAELEKELVENQVELDKLVELDIQRVDLLEDADIAEMIKLEKEKTRDEIEWSTADDARKQELLEKQQDRIKAKQDIVNKYPEEDVKEAYKESMAKAQAKALLARKANQDVTVEEGGKARAEEWIYEMEAAGADIDVSEGVNGDFYGATVQIVTKDKNGKERISTRIFVNKDTILKDGMVQTAAHEFMHATLYKTVMQDPGVRQVLGAELDKILRGPGVTISQKAKNDFKRMEGYSPEEQGEELFAFVAENMVSGDITIDDTGIGKFKDTLRRIWQNVFGYDINFNNTDDVRLFMKNYARNIKGVGRLGNKQDAAIEKMLTTAVGGKLIDKGKALKPGERSTEKMKLDFSKARESYIDRNPKQAKENKKLFDGLTQNEEGGKAWDNKEDWDSSAEKWDGFSLLDNSSKFIDNLIMSGVTYGEGIIRGEQDKKDFIKQVKEELQDRYIGGIKKSAQKKLDKVKEQLSVKDITPLEAAEQIEAIEKDKENFRRGFDPTAANGSLFGWLIGGSGNVTDSTMYHARGDVMKEWRKDPNRGILSLDSPIGEGGETFGSRLESVPDTGGSADAGIDPDSLTKVWEDLDLNEETVKSIESSIGKSGIDIGETAGFMGTKQETVGVDNVPVLKNGKPVLNKKGKPKTKTPSKVGDVKFSGRASGVLKAMSTEFGVDHRKVPTGITLLPKERTAIVDRLVVNPTAILNNIPDQHTRSGKAVGVQSVLLDAIFDSSGYRGGTKAATAVGDVGMSPQGIEIWKKKEGLDEVMLMEAFGVEGAIQNGQFVETGRFDPKSTKFDSVLKAAVSQMAALASNQQLRVQAAKNNSHPTDVIAEFGDGKNQLSFSKPLKSDGAKKLTEFKGNPAMLHGLVEFMREHPNLKLNPKQAVIAYAAQENLSLEEVEKGLANAATFIQENIDAVYGSKPWENPNLASLVGNERVLSVEYADNWKGWLKKLGFPNNFLFNKTKEIDRAKYHLQTTKWLQTLPTAALDNAMTVKGVLTEGQEGNFYHKAKEVNKIVAAEKARRKGLGKKFKEPTSNVNWAKVKFDSKLMGKLEGVTDMHAGIKPRAKRIELIARDANAIVAKSTSNPVENNKALDEVMGGFNNFINEKGISPEEKIERQRFVATTLKDQTNRTAGLIRGSAEFNAISMTPGKLHYKTVPPKKRRELARKLGIIDGDNKINDSTGDGKKIGSIVSGADSGLTAKDKKRLQPKVDKALSKFAKENGITVTEAKQQLSDEVNDIKTRHGEHDVALMLFTTTVFGSMTEGTFSNKYPIARKYYSQTALNEDLRVVVDKVWGKTGNAPGWYMGMPGYLRFVIQDPRAARDIIDLQTGTTIDKVIAADIVLNNISSIYSPIIEKARNILGKKGFEADWQSGGYNMIQFLQAERKEAPVESRFLHDKNIKEIKEAFGIVKEISYFTENELINNVKGDLTWEKMGRAMIKFLKTERKEAPIESRFLYDKNIEIIKKAMGIPGEISYFTEKKFNNFPKKSKDVISKLPEILKEVDTRDAFGGLIAEIAKSVYDGTDLAAAEVMAIRLANKFDNIESINKLRDAIAAKQPDMVTPDMTLEDIMGVNKATNISFSKPGAESKGITVLDFDDTLATTKSNVLYTMPGSRVNANEVNVEDITGWTTSKNKAILVVGGAGSGKSTLISGLAKRSKGFTAVNADAMVEAAASKKGLDLDYNKMSDRQRREVDAMYAKSNKAANEANLQGMKQNKGLLIEVGTSDSGVVIKQAKKLKDSGYEVKLMSVDTDLETAIKRNKSRSRTLEDTDVEHTFNVFDDNISTLKKEFGAEVIEFKDGFANVEKQGKLNAEEFAKKGGDLLAQGVKFDFSEFNKVVDGKTAPLFNKAMKLYGKFGAESMFILTARAPESQLAIKQFLDAQGLKIPLKNITGLGNSTAAAKALWVAEKVGEGYNDFYFADDAIQNVDAVREKLDELQVKNKVQQAKISFSMNTKRDLDWKSTDRVTFGLEGDRATEGKLYNAKFKVGDNEYVIRLTNRSLNVSNKFIKGDSVFDLEFALENQADELWDGAGKMGLEGTGRSGEVLSIVSNGVMDFIKNNNVDAVGFTSAPGFDDATSRTRLYSTLTKFWASKLGWEWASESETHQEDGKDINSGKFIISNPNPSDLMVSEASDKTAFWYRSTEEKRILSVNDVKGKTHRGRVSFSKSGPKKMSDIIDESEVDLNTILEESKGVGKEKTFSAAKAKQRGKGKGRFKFFVPPSADDFAGLCYSFFGKGKQGDKHHAWFKKNLFDPFSKGMRAHKITQQQVAGALKDLRKAMPEVRKKLNKRIPGTEYIHEDAIRVYNWTQAGLDIPGLSKADQAALVKAVESDAQLLAFAQGVNSASGTTDGMVDPGPHWTGGNIALDLKEALDASRSTHLRQWIENKNVIFNEANMNKIEAVYGSNFREALEDSLWRMENGGTRSKGGGRIVNNFTNWIHGSIGTTMFLNARSAMLQMISNVNFVNWSDNNMVAAAGAFANQRQYWKDVSMIFNSPFLKQRRSGIQTDVNAAELLAQIKDSKNKLKAATAYLLQLGFTPTQIADSFAIATGGATFYRNRIKTYLKEGMTKPEAETKAFEDMMEIAEETQQSTREDKISQQQASPLGKFILAFQNTPMQYNRLIKKAAQDLVNGRGDPKANISRIVYYGGIQNMIFYGLQQALFAALFSDDEEDEITDTKKERVVNGMIDTILRGSGIAGVAVATVKNVVLKFMKESEKMDDGKFYSNPDWGNVVIEALNVSPPIGIKARKIYSGLKTWEYNNDVIDHMDKTDIDNPIFDAVASVTEAVTNIPLSRLYNKVQNISESLDAEHETWKRVAMLLGWSKWSFGIKNQDVVAAKGEVKVIKAEEAVVKAEMKKVAKEVERQAENEVIEEGNLIDQEEERKAVEEATTDEEKKEAEKNVTCAAVSRSGNRCAKKPKGGGSYCTIHESVPAREDGVKSQCSHVKDDGKRCKMQTNNKSGKCYYHD